MNTESMQGQAWLANPYTGHQAYPTQQYAYQEHHPVQVYEPTGQMINDQHAGQDSINENVASIEQIPYHAPYNGVRVIATFDPKKQKVALKSSINPIDYSTYVKECEAAAITSRLPPNAMSSEEVAVMREHISHLQVTTYVTTRNAILRLWVKNPMLWVSREEALGIAKEERHFPLCKAIWDFLMRHGYINFGCLDVPEAPQHEREQKDIVIIGAGIAGLATARHLQTLLAVFAEELSYNYKIILLEARRRIGGRVYSHEFKLQKSDKPSRVDLGAQIITGFAGGNPLTVLLQRQLALPYRSLVSARNNRIHNSTGQIISPQTDTRAEGLFNLLLEVAAKFRYTPNGAKEEILPGVDDRIVVADKVLGVTKTEGTIASSTVEPIEELRRLGYSVREGSNIVPTEEESLGKTMKACLQSLVSIAEIPTEDLELLNWHWANMEYACGTNLDNLSLRYWDQDDGNEFHGHHAMVIGGYSQLARSLALAPSKLDIRTNMCVKAINGATIILETQEMSADKIVITLPLGVLKTQQVQFDPPLPDDKLSAIENLGYGLLNKVVLAYAEQFWDDNIDLIGSCPPTDQDDARGRFYLFWNCTEHASGRPVLVALMAGDAALACEDGDEGSLVQEATSILKNIYPNKDIPQPQETIITKWGRDPYSRGSYSFVAKSGSGADYEALAKPVEDRLFFAGEATCKTHPSTVHGAYLSGLAAARDVLDSLIGPQVISSDKPLVPIKAKSEHPSKTESKKRKFDTYSDSGEKFHSDKDRYQFLVKTRLTKEKDALQKLIVERIGERPEQPKRTNANPFLIFQKDQWNTCKAIADEAQQKKSKDPNAKASKNQIRACLGQTWRDTSDEGKQPWIEKVNQKRNEYETIKAQWEKDTVAWDAESQSITAEFDEKIRPTMITEDEVNCKQAIQGANGTAPVEMSPPVQTEDAAKEDIEVDNADGDEDPSHDEDDFKAVPILNSEADHAYEDTEAKDPI